MRTVDQRQIIASLALAWVAAALPAAEPAAPGSDPRMLDGRKLSEWMAEVDSADPGTRSRAVSLLTGISSKAEMRSPELLDRLLRIFRTGSFGERYQVAQALRYHEEGGERLAEALFEAIDAPHAGLRREVVHGLIAVRRLPAAMLRLLPLLDDPSREIRDAALYVLSLCEAKEVVDAFIALLDDANATARRRAVLALGRMHRPAGALLPIAARLGDADAPVRAAAAQALARVGRPERGKASVVFERLLDAVADADPPVRLEVLRALREVRPTEDGLIPARTAERLRPALSDADAGVREAAADTAGLLRSACAPLAGDLARMLSAAGEEERACAARALGRLRATDQAAALAERLADGAAAVRLEAAVSLLELKREIDRAIAVFAAERKALAPPRRGEAQAALLAVVEEHPEAMPSLLRSGLANEVRERIDLGVALRRLPDPLRAEASKQLVDVLAAPDPDSWGYALRYLEYLGPWPDEARLAVEPHLRSPEGRVREAAARFLSSDRRGMQFILSVLRDGRREERETILGVLATTTRPDLLRPAAPLFEEFLDDPAFGRMALFALTATKAPSVKGAAALRGLIRAESDLSKRAQFFGLNSSLFPPDDPALDELAGEFLAAFAKPGGERDLAVIAALAELGHRADPAVPGLVALLDRGVRLQPYECQAVANALRKIGTRPEIAAPALAALFDREEKVAAHEALLALGAHGARGLPKLLEVVRAPRSPYRGTALRAIRSVGSGDRDPVALLAPLLGEKDLGAAAAGALDAKKTRAAVEATAVVHRSELVPEG
jgi:HEAT repeat protein